MKRPVAIACVLAASAACSLASAQDTFSAALLKGGQSSPAALQSIDSTGVAQFKTPDGELNIPMEKVVRWGHPVDVAQGRLIILVDGSQVAAQEWVVNSDQPPLLLESDTLAVTPAILEPTSLPRQFVRGVIFELPAAAADRDRLVKRVRGYTAAEDAILLDGGDELTGHVLGLSGESVALESSVGRAQVPLSKVVAILFNAALIAETEAPRPITLVGLTDGSLLAAREVILESGQLQILLECGVAVRGASLGEVASLQPLGGKVVYLSDVEPLRYVHVPYLDLTWPLGRNENVLGGRLRWGGQLYTKGLGTRSAARLVYRLDGSHEVFAAHAAVDDSAGRGGSVVFRVLLAEESSWREVYTSPIIRGGDEPVPVYVPLQASKGLALVVDYADRGDELDHANWLDARLE